jgi:hypothetical protein
VTDCDKLTFLRCHRLIAYRFITDRRQGLQPRFQVVLQHDRAGEARLRLARDTQSQIYNKLG